MQASEEKERDWYGYAKYLEARIEHGARYIDLIRGRISWFLQKSAEDSLKGESTAIQFLESLSIHRDVHEFLINAANKLRGITHDNNQDQRSGDSDGTHGLGEVGSKETSETKEPNSISGAGRCGSERDPARNDSKSGGSSEGLPRSDDAIPEPLQEVPGGILGD